MIFKTIAKPEGFTLTQDEMNSVADSYKENYLTEGMTFKHWSSNPNADEPVTGDVVMTEDKHFYPVEQPKPVVQYDSDHSAWIGVDGTTVRLTTDTPESYFKVETTWHKKIIVGVIGMNTSESAWGGDFGIIDIEEIISSGTITQTGTSYETVGTLSYRSNDGKRTKTLKVTAHAYHYNTGEVLQLELKFVIYNADMVAVTNSDIIEMDGTQETHMLQYRVIE